MKLTNRAGLHPLAHRAVVAQAKAHPTMAQEKRFASVTELNSPACQVALKRKYWGQLEEESEKRIWALFGSALHKVLETGSEGERGLRERRLAIKVGEHVITGGLDSYEVEERWLADFKLTSVWSIVFGDRIKEWEAQTNIYAEMLRCAGFPVEKITAEVFLKDWSRRELDTDRKAALQYGKPCTYPDKDWQSIPLRIWSRDEVLAFVSKRISALEAALAADVPVECSKEERWEKETTWAVFKNKNKRATRVFKEESKGETRASAEAWIAAQAERAALKIVEVVSDGEEGRGDLEKEEEKELFAKAEKVRQKTLDLYTVEDRIGKRIRCQDYCVVKDFCPHFKRHQESMYGRDFGPDKDEETTPAMDGSANGEQAPPAEQPRVDFFGATPVPASVRRTRRKT